MTSIYKYALLTTFGISFAAATATAQGLGNTPYSALGLGEPLGSANVPNMGMGGIGMAYASPFYLNSQNPALLGRRLRYTIFEVGLLGQYKQLAQNVAAERQTQRDFGANIGYLALAFPVNSRWTSALSLRPHTYVDYTTTQFARIPGTIYETQTDYTGRGGINRAAWSNGFRIGNDVYLGAEAAFMFGNVTQASDTRVLIDDQTDVRTSRTNRLNYSDLMFRLGGAWRPKLRGDWFMNLGISYDPRTNLRAFQTDIYEQTTQTGTVISQADTINRTGAASVRVPGQLQVGIAFEKSNKFVVGLDAGFQPWSQFRTTSGLASNSLADSYYVAAGLEYTPKPTGTKYADFITYRAGVRYTQTPYVVDGRQQPDLSASLGISLPVGSSFVNHLNFSATFGQRGSVGGLQIRENYLRFGLGLSLNDFWFRRSVVD